MHCHRQRSPRVRHICLQDVTLLLCASFICLVFLCWLVSANQWWRKACVYFSEMCSAPAVTWMRWFVCTAAAHIKYNTLSVHFTARSRALYSNWIWAFFIPLCLPAFDMLSAWKFTAPCHSFSSNLLMCHSESHVMNKHADVQRDECWLEMR